jgi:hypothetical protein
MRGGCVVVKHQTVIGCYSLILCLSLSSAGETLIKGERASVAMNEQKKESPPSRTHKFIKVNKAVTYRLPPVDVRAASTQEGRPVRTGLTRPIAINPLKQSRWFKLGANAEVGILAIISEGARQVRAHVTSADLPPGAKIFIYSSKYPDELYGPFEGRGPNGDGSFWSPPVEGDEIIIEYFTPTPRSKDNPPFRITEISHVFR